jgi:signal transduction histidine kinase
MRHFFRGRMGSCAVFLLVAVLVVGGLGWVTYAALEVEREQFRARSDADLTQKLHVALWRLDGRVAPALAVEDSRPYNHFSAVFVPSVVLRTDGQPWQQGAVIEPSPLLSAEFPDWMRLHFQVELEDDMAGWESPQVHNGALRRRLTNTLSKPQLANVTDERRELLERLEKAVPPRTLLAALQERGVEPTPRGTSFVPVPEPSDNNANFNNGDQQRLDQQGPRGQFQPQTGRGRANPGFNYPESQVRMGVTNEAKSEVGNTGNSLRVNPDVAHCTVSHSGADWFNCAPLPASSALIDIRMSELRPLWLEVGGESQLLLVRLVRVGDDRQVCQGVVLNWGKLNSLLLQQVQDIFPDAELSPVSAGAPIDPERTMATLPVQLVPGTPAVVPTMPTWTPLRFGLVLAWAAALIALLAVGLGGWSLIDLAERRIRFVSAVTHELRTPLTTLRLYLDMLTSGFVKEEKQKEEYLQTLAAESDRLNRLVSNVLDFSRLENGRPSLQKTLLTPGALLESVRETWHGRCTGAGKELIIDSTVPEETIVETDVALTQQVLGNLLDNACKYSKGSSDCRVWVRARADGKRLLLEVEDRGPGVVVGERRAVFRPFRRGPGADVAAGGVGLGLALAQRWAQLLGGRLSLQSVSEGGACFRLELPL